MTTKSTTKYQKRKLDSINDITTTPKTTSTIIEKQTVDVNETTIQSSQKDSISTAESIATSDLESKIEIQNSSLSTQPQPKKQYFDMISEILMNPLNFKLTFKAFVAKLVDVYKESFQEYMVNDLIYLGTFGALGISLCITTSQSDCEKVVFFSHFFKYIHNNIIIISFLGEKLLLFF